MGKYSTILIGVGMFFTTVSVSILIGMGLTVMVSESVNPLTALMVIGSIIGVWVLGLIVTVSIIETRKNTKNKKK